MIPNRFVAAIAAITMLLSAGPAAAQPINQQLLDWLVPDRPSHPEFTDPVTLDSPNAAGRYLSLFADLDEDFALAAAWATGDPTILTYGDADDIVEPPMSLEELRARLEERQPWIEQVIEASKMERFDRRLSDDLFVRPLTAEDPRHRFHRGARATVRILRTDASRLWEAGDREAAIERIAAIIRLGDQVAADAVDLFDVIVAQAVIGFGADKALQYLDADPHVATDSLIAAVGELPVDDPARTVQMWNNTRAAVARVAEQGLQGDEISDRLLALLLQTDIGNILADQVIDVLDQALDGKLPKFDGEPATEPDQAELRAEIRSAVDASDLLKPHKLRPLLEEGRRLGDELAQAWYTEQGAERAEALEQRVNEDETLLLDTMLPIPRGIQKSSSQLHDHLQELREALAPEPEGSLK